MTFEEHSKDLVAIANAWNSAVQRACESGFKVEACLCGNKMKIYDFALAKVQHVRD